MSEVEKILNNVELEELLETQKDNVTRILGMVKISNEGELIPQNMNGIMRIAKAYWMSGWAPNHFKNVEAVFIAMCMGKELKLSYFMAVQKIFLVNGKACIEGNTGLALVRKSGLLDDYKPSFTGTYGEPDFTAHVEMKRKGQKTPCVKSFSIEDAKNAKLWMRKGKSGGDTPWVLYPKQMLHYRALGFALRDMFSDVLHGLYMSEELVGMEEESPAREDVTKNNPTEDKFNFGKKEKVVSEEPTTPIKPSDPKPKDGDPITTTKSRKKSSETASKKKEEKKVTRDNLAQKAKNAKELAEKLGIIDQLHEYKKKDAEEVEESCMMIIDAPTYGEGNTVEELQSILGRIKQNIG